jgi:hypothetical protein
MRALLLATLCLAAFAVAVPAAEAQPPGPGGCHVVTAYVTEASLTVDPQDHTVAVTPGASRPVECYY